jgi:DNA modification methylase
MCGDATKEEDVEKLMAGQDADMVFTDPPFAIYGSSTGVGQSVTDAGIVRPFFRAMCQAYSRITEWFGHIYVCCDWWSYPVLVSEAEDQLAVKNMIVWRKPGRGGQGSCYLNCHELIIFFVNQPEQKSMFDKPGSKRKIYDPNVWDAKIVPVGKRGHFAQKPMENIQRAIGNSSDQGLSVADLFGGSGSTLIACEQLNRKCYMMEIEPKYIDVIIERWQDFTGRKAKLVSKKGK